VANAAARLGANKKQEICPDRPHDRFQAVAAQAQKSD
jgi:hypothetical protein